MVWEKRIGMYEEYSLTGEEYRRALKEECETRGPEVFDEWSRNRELGEIAVAAFRRAAEKTVPAGREYSPGPAPTSIRRSGAMLAAIE